MGVALYRKYRSRRLGEIVGQEHVTTLLANAIQTDRLAHAYLFTGPRGVGKTSIARILAHEINELEYGDDTTHLDIIEIDAASNNGVEDIRDLRERVQIAPVSAKKKIYIIDEVHMLSKPAFNALLKTLEEPPEHVVFILATTDIDKVPETIISRTQRHTFRRASVAGIIQNLERIAKAEGATIDQASLEMIAEHADGSFRDSVSLFDQLLSGAPGSTITSQYVTESLGLASGDSIDKLITATVQGDIKTINQTLTRLESQGTPARTTAMQIAHKLRANIAENPSYGTLLDSLLDVSRSSYSDLKLLVTLAQFNPSSPPQSSQLTEPQLPPAPTPIPGPTLTPVKPKKTSVPKPIKSPPVQPADDAEMPVVEKIVKSGPSAPFEWDKLLAHVRSHHVALFSVLSKCDHQLDDTSLTLYTKSAFYKKKLDDTKYRVLLNDSLRELGFNVEIETVDSALPLKDSQAAKVAAIMGGGEEVSVEDA